jgi:hypothetical protein
MAAQLSVLRRWTVVVAAGEALGFLAPAVAGFVTASLPAATAVPLVLLAGAVEGAVLGAAQATVLGGVLPGLRRDRWIALTAAAAVTAYVLGFLTARLGGAGTALGISAAVGTGALLLVTVGGAQSIELRHHVPRAHRWVGWTALAWLLALATFLAIATPLWHAGQPAATAIAVGAAAGAAMAVVQAAVSGWGLVRLLDPPTNAAGRPADRSISPTTHLEVRR